jgi:hypothetical protein
MLEYFVHLDRDDLPNDLVLATAEVPDDLSVILNRERIIRPPALRARPAICRETGAMWRLRRC